MAKLNLARILEISKYLATKSGKELQDFLSFVSDFVEQISRIMRNGVSFSDNIDCKLLTLAVKHNTEQVVNTNGKQPIQILFGRVYPASGVSFPLISSFGWKVNAQGEVVVKVAFDSAYTSAIDISIIIIFS